MLFGPEEMELLEEVLEKLHSLASPETKEEVERIYCHALMTRVTGGEL